MPTALHAILIGTPLACTADCAISFKRDGFATFFATLPEPFHILNVLQHTSSLNVYSHLQAP